MPQSASTAGEFVPSGTDGACGPFWRCKPGSKKSSGDTEWEALIPLHPLQAIAASRPHSHVRQMLFISNDSSSINTSLLIKLRLQTRGRAVSFRVRLLETPLVSDSLDFDITAFHRLRMDR